MNASQIFSNGKRNLAVLIRGLRGVVATASESNRRQALCMGAGVAAVAILLGIVVWSSETPAKKALPDASQAKPAAYPSPASLKTDAEAERRKRRLDHLLLVQRADRESEAAIEREISRLVAFFTQCKQSARPFANEVLSSEATLEFAGSTAENTINGIYQLFGGRAQYGPDRFSRYITGCFERRVLKPADLQRPIDAVLTGYAAELGRIETRLLVDLHADVEAGDLARAAKLPPMNARDIVSASWDRVIGDVLDTVRNDVCISIGKFAASWVGGDILANQFTRNDDNALTKFGVNVAGGLAVDKALDEGLTRAGYDPAGGIAADVAAKLDAICELVIGGKPTHVGSVGNIAGGSNLPGSLGRNAAHAALVMRLGSLMGTDEPGLRRRLLSVHASRSRFRSSVLLPDESNTVSPERWKVTNRPLSKKG